MTSFMQRTYELLRQVPKGRVTTYKELAHASGTKAYRAVGHAMRHNPYSFIDCEDKNQQIPCHRVVATNGAIGGFMGKTTGKAIDLKVALLEQEGINVENAKVIDFGNKLFTAAEFK